MGLKLVNPAKLGLDSELGLVLRPYSIDDFDQFATSRVRLS